jgi:hypothetical protein
MNESTLDDARRRKVMKSSFPMKWAGGTTVDGHPPSWGCLLADPDVGVLFSKGMGYLFMGRHRQERRNLSARCYESLSK